MHFADSIFIFLLALILFGPKKLPEIGRQIGKLLVEFRRASNEFKAQIDEELRTMEQQDRQKKLEEAAQLTAPATTTQPSILPPSTGEVVSSSHPYGAVTPPELPEPAPSEPAIAVDASSSEPAASHESNGSHSTNGHHDIEPVAADPALSSAHDASISIHHG